ncbi:trans-sulfuration enzyme family protein [Paraburkholderia caballeronis]|uniref:Methionine-gamma-lyase n=1 Tax=Paraburkholderia caballeronis TaxID=416943 RepID=A0A1H7VDV5_9BURK|nr:aminotransferase class I/II-fold pyridoxal phosphate-dependent enzyme [Paraburkholderia caballeronis]PXW16925.1 methionine-gamma-lyase [Paraburkholderia caballeronis]PXW94627.1 methionine-gamma-lyase [Paraburkholderia caballeronis]RAJ89982.1 methionine-gamma-lyase [Paraburkholderia caballeronis]SEB58799.1 methionine-gamma-lyase [Paraburkholderia caballeronis]SEM07442.1 methionine-gamma-lyase [Paraburkholderia caballeronis]
MKRSTQVIHAGTERDPYGSVTTPVSRSGTSGFASVDEAGLFASEPDLYGYTRLGNPANAALERRMAALEGAGDCVVTASGIGAISTVMWTFLKPGDHLLADTALHGDTHALFAHALTRFGIEVDGVDFNDVDRVRDALKANTAIVYFGSPCNPTLKVNDIAALSALAHTHHPHVRVVVDNTFATPYLQNPLALGANLVVHSTTKYLGGHGDGVGGCICGTKADVARLRFDGIGHATGAAMAPDTAYLVLRGIATLSVRMERHCDNAAKLARYLAGSPHVARVHYPGLAADPGHAVAVTQMRAPGGMVALELAGSFEQAKAFVNGLKLIRIAVSPGGVESLIEHPASMTHAHARLAPDERPAAGIAPTLVRVSVGIEDVDDLIGDFDQAFRAMGD